MRQELLSEGADVWAKTSQRNDTALHLAVYGLNDKGQSGGKSLSAAHAECARLLLEANARLLAEKNAKGETALAWCLRKRGSAPWAPGQWHAFLAPCA